MRSIRRLNFKRFTIGCNVVLAGIIENPRVFLCMQNKKNKMSTNLVD
ncbi:hypothetical protein ACTJIJ_25360 [Niabella sp. 22666]